MIIPFPTKPATPAPAPARSVEPQGWPGGLRDLTERLAAIGMPCYPLAPVEPAA